MEFIKSNFINTTTQIAVDSNTLLASWLYRRDLKYQYASDGYNDDATTTSIVISFDETTTIDRLILQGINLKSFDIFFNGATANVFSFTGSAITGTSQFTTNSETSMYFRCEPEFCTSVTLDLKSTILADSEKAIGCLTLSEQLLDFERDPSAKNYTPMITPKQVVHKLSDGGIRTHTITEKWSTKISYKYISQTYRDNLKSIYDDYDSFIFTPFGTSSSWTLEIFDCVWPGKFDFYKFSDDAIDTGFTGKIDLRETSE